MTRINLVPPQELMDQHLFAEFREIKMVPMSLRRSIAARGVAGVLARIPPRFTLNTGHVSFFYDKGQYLRRRYEQLRAELRRRGVNFDSTSQIDPYGVQYSAPWDNDWEASDDDKAIVRARIAEKIALKPQWYRYEGKPIA